MTTCQIPVSTAERIHASMLALEATPGGPGRLVASVARVAHVDAARRTSRERAVCQLWAEEYPRLAGWCAEVLGDPSAAHEVAREAFVRLFSRWRTPREPRAFLYAAAAQLVGSTAGPLRAGRDGGAVDARQQRSEIADVRVVTEQSPRDVAESQPRLGL